MEFLTEYGMFLAKIVTLLIGLGMLVTLVANASKIRTREKGHLEVTSLNTKFDNLKRSLEDAMLRPEQRKSVAKSRKKQEKAEKKAAKKNKPRVDPRDKSLAKDSVYDTSQYDTAENSDNTDKNNVFVLEFHGDLRASAVEALRHEISAVLGHARPCDEIVVKLQSPGGLVHSYGLAASQLDRIKKAQIPLTICVDKVAASGGYMMACVADKILAAPFAVLGSIGVMAQIPNIHRLLKRHDIDVELMTAGKYKRTLTVLGENTAEGREKFQEELQDTHSLFKDYVATRRANIDIEEVATGEVWYGERALAVGLVDELKTSDEYLAELADNANLFSVKYIEKKTLPEKLGIAAEESSERIVTRWLQRSVNPDIQ